jgi:hypothetical protein
MAALKGSIAARGQQTPLEVVDLGPDAAPRYGLISGWRRLTALRALHAETGAARFASALALLRRPEGAADAYLAMVEENEIRAGLSFWERARIVARAADAGVFEGDRAALGALFGQVPRARRSKIGAFVKVYRALDGVLRFPAALPEKRGLALAGALEADPEIAARIGRALQADPPADAEAEQARLDAALKAGQGARKAAKAAGKAERPRRAHADTFGAPGREVRMRAEAGRVVLEGPGVNDGLTVNLRLWLARS